MDRNSQIAIAEKVRSAILAYAKVKAQPLTINDFCGAPVVSEHFPNGRGDPIYVERLVRGLHKLNWLERIYVSPRPGDRCRFAYQYTEPKAATPRVEAPADVKVVATKVGTLRISFRGLRIEIGVEQ